MTKTPVKQRLLTLVDQLLSEGRIVLQSAHAQTHYAGMRVANPTSYVEVQQSSKWRAGCVNLMRMLGSYAGPWKEVFDGDGNKLFLAKTMLGTLEAVRDAIDNDLLITLESMVFAEACNDLLEQADHLRDMGYYLAAGVLGRAVLEEHLRKWCGNAGAIPAKARPTLNDYKAELYKANLISKIEQSHIDSMAAVGNDAAHNKGSLKGEDVERLLRDVREFLLRNPLT